MYCCIIHYSLYICSMDHTYQFSILLLLQHQRSSHFLEQKALFHSRLACFTCSLPIGQLHVDLSHGASFKHLFHLVNSYFLARDICLGIHILKYFGHVLLFPACLQMGVTGVCAHVVNMGQICLQIEADKFSSATPLSLHNTSTCCHRS